MTRLEEESRTKHVSEAHFTERLTAMKAAISQRVAEHSSRMAQEGETDQSTHRCEYSQFKGACKQLHQRRETYSVRIDSVRSKIQDSENRITRLV